MGKDPLISVIITNYNYGEYIGQCIESVLNQTYQNIELIIINDGSTDKSDKIIKSYIKQYPEVIYINQKNQGANVARNKGIEKAKGKYIFLLDADNWLNPDHLEKLYKTAAKTGADVVYTDLRHFGDSEDRHEMPDFNISHLKIANFIDTASLVRKKSIGKNRFDMRLNRKFLQDYDFFLGLALKGLKFVKCDTAVLNYRVHEKQHGSKYTVEKLERAAEIHRYIYEKYKKKYPTEFGSGEDLANELVVSRLLLQKTNLELTSRCSDLQNDYDRLKHQYEEIERSLSWKITKPLRKLGGVIKHRG